MFKWIKTRQVRRRLIYTFLILIAFKIGTYLTLPGVNISTGENTNSLLTLFNLTSGSSLSQFGLFALGVSPYISASIIIGIFAQGVLPYYKRLRDSGESGNIKIAQHTRVLTLIIAFIQAFTIMSSSTLYESIGLTFPSDTTSKLMLAGILAMGSLLVLYMAESIDLNGIGNGQSLIITTGIITQLPVQLYSSIKYQSFYGNTFWQSFYIMVAVLIVITVVSIFVNNKEYKIPLQNMTSNVHTKAHYLPVKLLVSSVTPVIFASSVISLGGSLATVFNFDSKYFSFYNIEGIAVYATLIILFSFIYNLVQVSGTRVSDDLNKTSMYITNIRPTETKSYINKKILKITLIGSPILVLLASTAMLVELFLPVKLGLAISGTSLFIVVSAIQELVSQVNGLTDKNNYKEIF